MNDESFLLREKYGGVRTKEYEADLIRLRNGEPVDYLIGWKPFLDCKIYLESRPLIPRTETEYWVEQAIGAIEKNHPAKKDIRCLDLFAGSGAIGIAVLKHLPRSRVDFGEIDERHFPTIRKNLRVNGIDTARSAIIPTDVWSAIVNRYDAIFANPPYLSRGRQERVEASVLSYEPTRALFAEEDGFALIRKTLAEAATHLFPRGALYMEHDPEQSDALGATAKKYGLRARTGNDQFGVARFSILTVA